MFGDGKNQQKPSASDTGAAGAPAPVSAPAPPISKATASIAAEPAPIEGPMLSAPPLTDSMAAAEQPQPKLVPGLPQPITGNTPESVDNNAPKRPRNIIPPSMSPPQNNDDVVMRAHPPPSPSSADAGLLGIKQLALQNLAPLVDKLNQTPEERFKTTMMLIQASDNAQLVGKAYEAANNIADEKTRAQALLDVVNEINYFTQRPSAKSS